MPLSQLNRRRFCHVVGIIPGPKEPVNIDPYLEDLLQDFNNYGPAGESQSVVASAMLLAVLVLDQNLSTTRQGSACSDPAPRVQSLEDAAGCTASMCS